MGHGVAVGVGTGWLGLGTLVGRVVEVGAEADGDESDSDEEPSPEQAIGRSPKATRDVSVRNRNREGVCTTRILWGVRQVAEADASEICSRTRVWEEARPPPLTMDFKGGYARIVQAIEVARGVHLLPFALGQAYLVETMGGLGLFDTSILGSGGEILATMSALGFAARDLKHIAVSHYHDDHRGALAELLEATEAVSMAGTADAPVIRGTVPQTPPNLTPEEVPFAARITVPVAPASRIDHELRDGDEAFPGAFAVHVPGHTGGSIALHLRDRGVLLTGDVIASMNGVPILGPFNVDRECSKESVRKLATLSFEVACFGHGDPVRAEAHSVIREFAARL